MIVLVIIISLVLSLDCPKYDCSLNNLELSDSSYCIYEKANTYYLNLCNSFLYRCQPIDNYNQTKCTYYDSYSPHSLLPGEKCNYASDCYQTNYCIKGVCVGTNGGEGCNSDAGCDIGYYCDESGTCAGQIPVNQYGCLYDYECVNNAGCYVLNATNPKQNQCIKYYSLENGKEFPISESPLLCQSAFINNLACHPAPVSSKFPNQCNDDLQCTSTTISGVFFNTTCECGYNTQGFSYCNLFAGDKISQQYTVRMKKWLTSTAILKCHTLNRFEKQCITQMWDKDDAAELIYYYYYTNKFPLVYKGESCALKIFMTDYYSAMQDLPDSKSDAVYFILSLVILII